MSTSIYECGDGVPSSNIVERNEPVATGRRRQLGGARGGSIVFAVLGQGLLALTVALGGHPAVGAVAAVAVLVCSLVLALAEASRTGGGVRRGR